MEKTSSNLPSRQETILSNFLRRKTKFLFEVNAKLTKLRRFFVGRKFHSHVKTHL
jgi:hypothetical protein